MFLTAGEAVMVLSRSERREKGSPRRHEPAPVVQQAVVRMRMEGGAANAPVVGLERQPGISAYFIGNDPAKWRPEVPRYSRVEYKRVYPGVDLVYYGDQRQVEYDFEVAPGADPGQIRLAYEGAERTGEADRLGVPRHHPRLRPARRDALRRRSIAGDASGRAEAAQAAGLATGRRQAGGGGSQLPAAGQEGRSRGGVLRPKPGAGDRPGAGILDLPWRQLLRLSRCHRGGHRGSGLRGGLYHFYGLSHGQRLPG